MNSEHENEKEMKGPFISEFSPEAYDLVKIYEQNAKDTKDATIQEMPPIDKKQIEDLFNTIFEFGKYGGAKKIGDLIYFDPQYLNYLSKSHVPEKKTLFQSEPGNYFIFRMIAENPKTFQSILKFTDSAKAWMLEFHTNYIKNNVIQGEEIKKVMSEKITSFSYPDMTFQQVYALGDFKELESYVNNSPKATELQRKVLRGLLNLHEARSRTQFNNNLAKKRVLMRASKTEVSSSSSSTESVSTNGEKKGKEVKKRRHV